MLQHFSYMKIFVCTKMDLYEIVVTAVSIKAVFCPLVLLQEQSVSTPLLTLLRAARKTRGCACSRGPKLCLGAHFTLRFTLSSRNPSRQAAVSLSVPMACRVLVSKLPVQAPGENTFALSLVQKQRLGLFQLQE